LPRRNDDKALLADHLVQQGSQMSPELVIQVTGDEDIKVLVFIDEALDLVRDVSFAQLSSRLHALLPSTLPAFVSARSSTSWTAPDPVHTRSTTGDCHALNHLN
jgi:hypothetical protein